MALQVGGGGWRSVTAEEAKELVPAAHRRDCDFEVFADLLDFVQVVEQVLKVKKAGGFLSVEMERYAQALLEHPSW